MEADWEPRNILVNLKDGKHFVDMLELLTSKPEEWSPFLEGNNINCDTYHLDPDIIHLRRLLRGMADCAKFLDVDRRLLDQFEDVVQELGSPERLGDFDTFLSLVKGIGRMLKGLNKEAEIKLARMSREECSRIDEAIVCLRHYCYYASTVMSVSAVESRLHALIRKTDKNLYEKRFGKATIGQILGEITVAKKTDPETGKLVGLIPAKHQPLLDLLNVYRVYSAHPKGEEVTAQIQ